MLHVNKRESATESEKAQIKTKAKKIPPTGRIF